MPSCVIKNCRSNTRNTNKSKGVTFHRFPLSDKAWKDAWVQIIREVRDEPKWDPKKSSVICSIHFEDCDLYTTKCRNFRIVPYAVPKKFLAEMSCNQPDEAIISTYQEISLDPLKIPELPEVNNSSALHGFPLEAAQIKIEELDEPNTSTASNENLLVAGQSSMEGMALQRCQVLLNRNSMDLQNSLSQVSLKGSSETVTSPYGDNLKKPLLVLDTPENRRINARLVKMHTMILNQKKKIKTLNQKIRRLQNRNKSLKDIFRSLKGENFNDSDLSNEVNEDITAANIFHNHYRRKLNKKVKYTPSMRKFCLTLNYYSPKAYDYVRQTFNTCLPHQKTLAKWRINGVPESTEESSVTPNIETT